MDFDSELSVILVGIVGCVVALGMGYWVGKWTKQNWGGG